MHKKAQPAVKQKLQSSEVAATELNINIRTGE